MTTAATTQGQRKTALLLMTMRSEDRRQLLSRLPRSVSGPVRRLVAELEAMPWPVAEFADALLAEEVWGLTARNSLDLEQIVTLSQRLPASWFARALVAWPGLDRNFCLSLLDPPVAAAVRRELDTMSEFSPRVADAIKAEVVGLLSTKVAA